MRLRSWDKLSVEDKVNYLHDTTIRRDGSFFTTYALIFFSFAAVVFLIAMSFYYPYLGVASKQHALLVVDELLGFVNFFMVVGVVFYLAGMVFYWLNYRKYRRKIKRLFK